MSNLINETPITPKNIEVYRGAPEPFIFRRLVNSVYQPFDSTLTCIVTPYIGAPFTLGVGTGITLSSYNSVALALATLQLTAVQSNLIAKGSLSSFIFLQGPNGSQIPVLAGNFIGTGA